MFNTPYEVLRLFRNSFNERDNHIIMNESKNKTKIMLNQHLNLPIRLLYTPYSVLRTVVATREPDSDRELVLYGEQLKTDILMYTIEGNHSLVYLIIAIACQKSQYKMTKPSRTIKSKIRHQPIYHLSTFLGKYSSISSR